MFTLALLVPSVVLHELAHGHVSLRHGAPIAKDAGRLSLNPLRHVDLFGTVLLSLMLWSAGAAFTRVNLVLMFFNLIPVPPLDGSSVLPLFLSNRGLYTYYRLQRLRQAHRRPDLQPVRAPVAGHPGQSAGR